MTEQEKPDSSVVSRRQFIGGGIAAAGAAAGLGHTDASFAQSRTSEATDDDAFKLVNGKIHTLDRSDRVVSQLLVRNGRFAAVGDSGGPQDRNVRTIDLKGRTVVPGLIEGHVHMMSLASRPGYHVVLENARSIHEIQQLLVARRRAEDVPDGQFITAMGGWHPNFFAERRLPTLQELDDAVPDRPVFLYQIFDGPARTNTRGKQFFEKVSDSLAGSVAVAADGTIESGLPSTTALYHLRTRQTFEDRKRSCRDAMAYAASVGLTAILEQAAGGDSVLAPTQGLSNLDRFHPFDPWIAVHREGKALVRYQMNFYHGDDADLVNFPELRARLRNAFQLFGDDMLMTGGIGEWSPPDDDYGPAWLQRERIIAQARWRNTDRSTELRTLEPIVAGLEAVNAEFDISGLRWTVHHVQVATPELLKRLKAIGVGVQCGSWTYTDTEPSETPAGSPFRMVQESGIQNGIHMDGVHIAPLSPWPAIYYAATGLNSLGQMINPGQQISRRDALRLYTRENAWHMNMEDRIGTIERGKLADLVVLDRDMFTCTDEELRRIRPVLTLVGGKVVHDAKAI